MAMRRSRGVGVGLFVVVIAGALLGCDPARPPAPAESDPVTEPDPAPGPAEYPTCSAIPECDASIHVDPASSAMLITDPEVLAKVPLRRVMGQLVASAGAAYGPEEAMARLFDTMSSEEYGKFSDVLHCDTASERGLASVTPDTLMCPRAEGALASSAAFFEEGHPDSFVPVAIVNRFDLTPINAGRCGQYRIVYAKRSGLADPDDRVFLIFEPALRNPVACLEACRPIAKGWAALEGASTAEIADFVEALFFEGLHGFAPVMDVSSFGPPRDESLSGSYGGGFKDEDEGGQIRVSMHMGDPWDMRELRFASHPLTGRPTFLPMPVRNNPPVAFFDPDLVNDGSNPIFHVLLDVSLPSLVRSEVAALQLFVPLSANGLESAIEGPKKNDYHAAATKGGSTLFVDMIEASLEKGGFVADCPPDDPLDGEAILDRATTQSCAGCHSPRTLIGEDRKIGCGLTWPDSIGQVHVTEKSEISPALKDVFLPHRAKVLEGFLQACDMDAMFDNLQNGQPEDGFQKVLPAGTLGGSGTH